MLRSQGPPGGLPQPSLAPKSTPGTTTDGDSGTTDSGAVAGSSSSGTNHEPPSVQPVDLSKPPGCFQLLFDEDAGFEYKSDKRIAAEARKEAKKTAAATASTPAAAAAAVAASN